MNFSVSPNAIKRISKLLKDEEHPETYLRVSVVGGGCSGFQYHFDFDHSTPADDDLILEEGNSKVVIDKTSLEFLQESVLDYVEMLGGSAFEIKNPNATASCGCGNSFAV